MRDGVWARYAEERLPRYTSYPTAPHFTAAVSDRHYGEWLAGLESAPASLYLHIPFCRSMCWYCGCHTTVARRDAPILDYLGVLRREIDLVAGRLTRPLAVRQIHFGGGTPTILAPSDFADLVRLLRARFDIEAAAEVAVEIDPRTLTSSMIDAFGEVGIKRASLGVQSFDPVVQQAINRRQSVEQTAAAVTGLRAIGIQGISFDLIYGLPHQTVRSCVETVEQCVALRPGRFAVFGYAHLPTFKKHQQKIDESSLPDGVARQEQAETIAERLIAAGYERIGIDHFALPEDSLALAAAQGTLHRNFQGYTTDPCETLIGFGASAIGRLPQGYLQNEVVLGRYAERVLRDELPISRGYRLTADDRLRAELIERLMCDLEVDVAAICARHHVEPAALLRSAERLPALAADGIVLLDGNIIRLAKGMRVLARTVASAFDAHLAAAGRTFSRAV